MTRATRDHLDIHFSCLPGVANDGIIRYYSITSTVFSRSFHFHSCISRPISGTQRHQECAYFVYGRKMRLFGTGTAGILGRLRPTSDANIVPTETPVP